MALSRLLFLILPLKTNLPALAQLSLTIVLSRHNMKIVCICESGASVNCIASGLIHDHEIAMVIVPDFSATKPKSKKPSTKKKRPKKKKNALSRIANRLFFKVVPMKVSHENVEKEIHARGTGELNLKNACSNFKSVPAYAINSKSTAALIAEQEPDILFVCGAPILRNRIFEIAKYGSVNFHYGYSPKYKGQHTLLWAYNRADHQSLGGTFLKIDAGVDTGTPIAFMFPEVEPSDSLDVIEAKLALLARDNASAAVAAALKTSPESIVNDDEDRQEFMIRHADYGLTEQLRYYAQRIQNKFFRGGSVLREEEVKIV